jgi:hypothetical protein
MLLWCSELDVQVRLSKIGDEESRKRYPLRDLSSLLQANGYDLLVATLHPLTT